jgi:putative DNA primase/helicase
MIDIKIQLHGKWTSVLQSIGFPIESLTGKHGPCPFCHESGKDRFRWDKNKEFSICNVCGPRSPIDMAMSWLNMSYKETAQYLRPNREKYTMTEIKAPDTAANEARIKKIHAGLKRITGDCIASRYLAVRGIDITPDQDCYFHPAIPFFEDGNRICDYPAMVSVIRTPGAAVASYHITYLGENGKAGTSSDRKILPTINSLDGAAIRLFEVKDTLCIAEGVESSLSVHVDTGLPVWAAVNAGMMEKIVVPESVKFVYIYADEDKSFRGAKAAYTLANKLMAQGKEVVRVIRLVDQQQWVDGGDKFDMNDYIIASRPD